MNRGLAVALCLCLLQLALGACTTAGGSAAVDRATSPVVVSAIATAVPPKSIEQAPTDRNTTREILQRPPNCPAVPVPRRSATPPTPPASASASATVTASPVQVVCAPSVVVAATSPASAASTSGVGTPSKCCAGEFTHYSVDVRAGKIDLTSSDRWLVSGVVIATLGFTLFLLVCTGRKVDEAAHGLRPSARHLALAVGGLVVGLLLLMLIVAALDAGRADRLAAALADVIAQPPVAGAGPAPADFGPQLDALRAELRMLARPAESAWMNLGSALAIVSVALVAIAVWRATLRTSLESIRGPGGELPPHPWQRELPAGAGRLIADVQKASDQLLATLKPDQALQDGAPVGDLTAAMNRLGGALRTALDAVWLDLGPAERPAKVEESAIKPIREGWISTLRELDPALDALRMQPGVTSLMVLERVVRKLHRLQQGYPPPPVAK